MSTGARRATPDRPTRRRQPARPRRGRRCRPATSTVTSAASWAPPWAAAAAAKRAAKRSSWPSKACRAASISSSVATRPPPSRRHNAHCTTSARRRMPQCSSRSANALITAWMRSWLIRPRITSPYTGCARVTRTLRPSRATAIRPRPSIRSRMSMSTCTRRSSSPTEPATATSSRQWSSPGARSATWPATNMSSRAEVDRRTSRHARSFLSSSPCSSDCCSSSRSTWRLPPEAEARRSTVSASTGPSRTRCSSVATSSMVSGGTCSRRSRPSFSSVASTSGTVRPDRIVAITNTEPSRVRGNSKANEIASNWSTSSISSTSRCSPPVRLKCDRAR